MEKNELLNMVLVPDLVIEMLKGLSNKQYREFFEKYFNYYLHDIPFETNDMTLKIIFAPSLTYMKPLSPSLPI